MKPTFRTYYYFQYENGWMVRWRDDEGDDQMEMCYTTEEVAKSHTDKANEREPKRYAERMASYEKAMANFHYESILDYYGKAGRYYGD